MKQAMVIYFEHGFKDGSKSRLGYRKEHDNRHWYMEVAKQNADGTYTQVMKDRGYSLRQALDFAKYMKKEGYKISYELI